jgi:hypothetical protein
MDTHTTASTVTIELRSVLLELARRQDDLAANEAAATPYWSHALHPSSDVAPPRQFCAPRPTTCSPRVEEDNHERGPDPERDPLSGKVMNGQLVQLIGRVA